MSDQIASVMEQIVELMQPHDIITTYTGTPTDDGRIRIHAVLDAGYLFVDADAETGTIAIVEVVPVDRISIVSETRGETTTTGIIEVDSGQTTYLSQTLPPEAQGQINVEQGITSRFSYTLSASESNAAALSEFLRIVRVVLAL